MLYQIQGYALGCITLIWAQTAGVWHWHHHSSTGEAQPVPGWEPSSLQSFRSIPGKVTVVGDTMYVLGTASRTVPSHVLSLPNSPINMAVPNPDARSTYVAAYDRRDGRFLWSVHMHGMNPGTEVRGVEILVSPDHIIYLILSVRGFGDLLVYNDASGAQGLGIIPSYATSVVVRFPVPPAAGSVVTQWIQCSAGIGDCSSFEGNLFSLLLHGGKLWASGTLVRPSNTGAFLSGLLGPLSGLLGALFAPITAARTEACLLRMDPTTLQADSLAVVRGDSFLSISCYGRSLFAYDPSSVGWLVAMRGISNPRYWVAGALSGLLVPERQLCALRVQGANMQLQQHWTIAEYSSATTPPPPYWVAFERTSPAGGFLYWAVADTASYSIPGFLSLPSTSEPRLIIGRTGLMPTGVLHSMPVYTTTLPSLQLAGLAVETETGGSWPSPVQYVYVSGSIAGPGWSLLGMSGAVSLEGAGAPTDTSGFVLGLQWRIGWRYVGYKRLHSTVGAPRRRIFVGGMARHSTLPQLYLYGWGRDNMVVEPRWSDGSSQIAGLSGGTSPSRLWVGRLDLYRLLSISTEVSFPVCVPESLPPHPLQVTGSWDATTSRELVWVPESIERRYRALHDWAGVWADSLPLPAALIEGQASFLRPLLAPGRLPPGRYFLALRSPVLGRHFADILDTTWLVVGGTTTPFLQRSGTLGNYRIVVPWAGGPLSLPLGSGSSGPFYRTQRRFNSIRQLVYAPWEAMAGGSERLYVFDREGASPPYTYRLYSLDFISGQVTLLRSWTSNPSDPQRRGDRLFGDPYRGRLWSYDTPNRTLWRLHPTDPTQDRELPLRGGVGFSPADVSPSGYPIGVNQSWVYADRGFHLTERGDIVGIVAHLIAFPNTYRWVLVRVDSPADSTFIVAGGEDDSPCPEEGVGYGFTLAPVAGAEFSSMTSDGDTLYWVQWQSGGCGSSARVLRKAWPTSPARRFYEVQTIDTLDLTGSTGYFSPLFSRVPTRGLYVVAHQGMSRFLLWYDLGSQQWDTLLTCAASLCCDYELSDFVNFGDNSVYTVLRSGAILFSAQHEIRAALPVRLAGQGDTLRGEVLMDWASEGTPSLDNLTLLPASDSTRITVRQTGCDGGKSFWYGSYEFPSGFLELVAPDSVCEGMQFSSFVRRVNFPQVENCRVGFRLAQVQSQMGRLQGLFSSGNESQWWKALSAGDDTLLLGFTRSRWAWLVSLPQDRYPIRIRAGHRLRMRVALEGPWVSAPGRPRWMKPHPFLNRYALALYNEGTNGVSPDSLWRLPKAIGDSLPKQWNFLLIEPLGLGCPGEGGWFCDSIGVNLVRIEVHNPAGQVIDSAYGLVDSVGRVYLYRAPLGNIDNRLSFNADTLHFCFCDLTTPKYFVLRTPNHLPLYTQTITLPARGIGQADSLDLTDPSTLRGIPGVHYALLPDSTVSPPRMRAGAWAGNCADLYNSFAPGPHYDAGVINAADWEFLLPRNGIATGFSWADLDSDGKVDAVDAVLLLQNQNALRQSVGP